MGLTSTEKWKTISGTDARVGKGGILRSSVLDKISLRHLLC